MIKFSIITPTFNQLKFLPQTARSILSQEGDFQLEWLVIDAASTDGTLDYLKSLTDPRLKFLSEPDRGQSHAINKGLALATGDIVAWLNSDDLYLPGALQRVAKAFEKNSKLETRNSNEIRNPNDERRPSTFELDSNFELRTSNFPLWLIAPCDVIDEQGTEIRSSISAYKNFFLKRYSYRALLRENFISQPSVFWRKTAATNVDESLHYTMDYDLWLRLAQQGDPIILNEPLSQFRLHPSSKSGQVTRAQFDEQYQVAKRYFNGDKPSQLIHRLNVEKIVWSYRLMRLLKI